jgi:hypothetical protein
MEKNMPNEYEYGYGLTERNQNFAKNESKEIDALESEINFVKKVAIAALKGEFITGSNANNLKYALNQADERLIKYKNELKDLLNQGTGYDFGRNAQSQASEDSVNYKQQKTQRALDEAEKILRAYNIKS